MSKTATISPFKERWLQAIYSGQVFILNKTSPSVRLLNMGYAGKSDLKVDDVDQYEYLQLQLYHHITQLVDLSGKDILEVGSGMGGGCYYACHYHQPKQFIGLDLNVRNLNIAKMRYASKYANVHFMHGHACTFNLPAASQDVVINIESSHCYPDMAAFLQKVYQVLRKGGWFCFGDVRRIDDLLTLEQAIQNSGLHIVKKEDISTHVLQALSLDNDRRRNLLDQHWILRWFGGNSFLVKGSDQYQALEEGTYVFLHYLLKK